MPLAASHSCEAASGTAGENASEITTMLSNIPLVGLILALIQCAAALPWVLLLLPESPKTYFRKGNALGTALGLVASVVVVMIGLLFVVKDRGNLQLLGKIYGSVLHAQLVADLFVALFAVVLVAWPKGGAVALAAFREGVRQPMFYLIGAVILVAFVLIPFIPYFTFGEDYLMARDLGLEVIMLWTVIFCALLASMSISEEIEGRTAVTLMSKPVSRRQFLLGKFVGILFAGLLMTLALGWVYCWMMDFKNYYERVHWYEISQPTQFPSAFTETIRSWVAPDEGQALVRGATIWVLDASESIPGLVLGFCHVMVLLAAAVCLATRLPVAANIVTCGVLFVLGHLSPMLRQSAEALVTTSPSVATKMLSFVAQLFELVLPGLELFSPTRITDVPISMLELASYAGRVTGHAVLYTVVLLLFGLILFEDRDLA